MTWILSSIPRTAGAKRKACGRIQSGPEFKTRVQSPFPPSEKSKTVPRIREAQERSVQRRNVTLLNPVYNTNHVPLSLFFLKLIYIRSRSVSRLPCIFIIGRENDRRIAPSVWYISRYASSSLCIDTLWHSAHCRTHNGHYDLMLSPRVILEISAGCVCKSHIYLLQILRDRASIYMSTASRCGTRTTSRY